MFNDEIVESNKGIQKNITQTSSLFYDNSVMEELLFLFFFIIHSHRKPVSLKNHVNA